MRKKDSISQSDVFLIFESIFIDLCLQIKVFTRNRPVVLTGTGTRIFTICFKEKYLKYFN